MQIAQDDLVTRQKRDPHPPVRPGSVREAIKQTRPFRTPGHEAVLALFMTAERVRWPFQDLFAEHDLTHQQYNVLRILRGAGKNGLPTLEIADRMVERTPGVTRLIDRLVAKDLVERTRSAEDRRQVLCTLLPEGRKLLSRLGRAVDTLDSEATSCLQPREVQQLIKLLDKVRNHTTTTDPVT